jgi:phage terminase large subunit
VTHRRAGKTVACVQDLQRAALDCQNLRPRFAYLAPFLKQSKAVVWDYLRAAMAPLRRYGATVHESELRVDYPEGGQVRLQRMIPKSCRLFGIDHASRKDRGR